MYVYVATYHQYQTQNAPFFFFFLLYWNNVEINALQIYCVEVKLRIYKHRFENFLCKNIY